MDPKLPCVEVLPAQKSSPHNGLTWVIGEGPGEGVLTVTTARAVSTYGVREIRTAWPGRAFRLDVIRGGTDPESESYDVFAADDPRGSHCDCKGFTYGRGRPCKHLLAVRALVENRWV